MIMILLMIAIASNDCSFLQWINFLGNVHPAFHFIALIHEAVEIIQISYGNHEIAAL